MTDKQFYILWCEALVAQDRDAYVSDYTLTSLWEIDTDADTNDAMIERANVCGRIYDLAHASIAEIRATTGLSQARFAERFCIPKRTLENWESASTTAGRSAPPYVRLMLAKICGLMEGLI